MQKRIAKILKQVADETSTPIEVVEAMFESQFRCSKEKIKEATAGQPDTFVNIRLINLGLFVAMPGKILKLHEYSNNSK